MTKLKSTIEIESAFNSYVLDEVIGEGGAGRVYGGRDAAGAAIAVKVLVNQSRDKRQRFKNEIAFLQRANHKNIVSVTDYGTSELGPYYVMSRYHGSLRPSVGHLSPAAAMAAFSQIADGVEAAHLRGATHRDLKPENVLVDDKLAIVAVADFGVANFTVEGLATLVETAPNARLANFQYAAPEQRSAGGTVGRPADIYALGLILNELFTGSVPHGTEYISIASRAPEFAYLDKVVSAMIRQSPGERPQSVEEVKELIRSYDAEAVTLQKLRELDKVVVPAGEVTDPLAFTPPKVIGAEYDGGTLRLKLDMPVNSDWVAALNNMGSFSAPMEAPPSAFRFSGTDVFISIPDYVAQSAIDHFKAWLPRATAVLKYTLERRVLDEENRRRDQLKRQRMAEERKLEINRSLRI